MSTMEADAEGYDELSQPQIESGSKFIDELSLSAGNKVLDMGCGTGILSKYLADIVGSGGEVVGIDPDAARIKIAEGKFQGISALKFHVGSNATGFPHDNEPYYDVHVSTFVYHWLSNDEKKLYIQKAYQCLKPEGKLAILCAENSNDRDDQNEIINSYPLTQEGYRNLFNDLGLFPDASIEKVEVQAVFKSFAKLRRWVKASSHHDLDDLDPAYVKAKMEEFVTIEPDGSMYVKYPYIAIKANKT